MIKHPIEQLKHHIVEALKAHPSPHDIGFGFAIGTFIAILPTPFMNVLIALIVSFVFRNINKVSLFGAIAFWNIFTLIPVYYLAYKIGDFLFGPGSRYDLIILNPTFDLSAQFVAGTAILAVIFSVAFYFIVKGIAHKYQEKH